MSVRPSRPLQVACVQPFYRRAIVDDTPVAEPFARWPIQPGGRTIYGVVWFTHPAVFVTQAHIEHGTVAAVMILEATVDRILARYAREIAEARGLLVIHDWRKVVTFDPRVVPFYIDRMTGPSRRAIRGITLSLQLNPLARLGLRAVSGALSRVHGQELQLTEDLRATLATHKVQRPDPSLIVD